ncbi:MAG: Hydrolase, TatD family [Parcubacteria group bacterium GW2011_GWA2_46_7]|nr:MAG: Hydrolase, TatD family [Parcubacteria group bacterium GW2011_GWA2_46_7]
MFIDSHCHLPHGKYTKTTEQLIQDALSAGVTNIIAIGTSVKENESAIKTADSFGGVYCSVGIHVDEDRDKTTESLFEMQIQLAIENNLSVIIHNRNGDDTVVRLLKQYVPQGLRAIAHSFSQSWEYAQQLLSLGAYLSFSGMITYKGRKNIAEIIQKMPLDRMLIETDAPYLPPEGFRGQPNEPKNVVAVAQKIAEVRVDTLEHIALQTYENTKTIFAVH